MTETWSTTTQTVKKRQLFFQILSKYKQRNKSVKTQRQKYIKNIGIYIYITQQNNVYNDQHQI